MDEDGHDHQSTAVPLVQSSGVEARTDDDGRDDPCYGRSGQASGSVPVHLVMAQTGVPPSEATPPPTELAPACDSATPTVQGNENGDEADAGGTDADDLEDGERAGFLGQLGWREHDRDVDLFQEVEGLLTIDDVEDEDCFEEMELVGEAVPYLSQPLTSTKMRPVHRRLHRVVRWERLLAILCLDGRSSFPENLYKIMAAGICTSSAERRIALPDPRTVRNTLRPQLLAHCYAQSRVLRLQENARTDMFTTSTHLTNTDNGGQSDPLDCVRLVRPTEWAKLDVCTVSFYDDAFQEIGTDEASGVNVEMSAIVTERRATLLRDPTVRARFKNSQACQYAGPDDTLEFKTTTDPKLHSSGIYGWLCTPAMDVTSNSGRVNVIGDIGPTVVVGSPSPPAPDGSRSRFRTDMPASYIRAEDAVLQCCSIPTCTLNVPVKDLTAPCSRETRNVASSSRSTLRQTTLAGLRATCDLDIFPGDTITAIRPRGETITESVICMFHTSPVSALARKTAEALVWVVLDSDEDGSVGDRTQPTKVTTIASSTVIGMPVFHFSNAKICEIGASRFTSSNTGRLPSGERYVVYRASLYADGFQANKTTRTSKSVGGIYLLPQGRSVQDRSSAKSVRPLCLVPHGMPYGPALKVIMDDLVTAAQTGVDGVDPDGRHVRIYIDTLSFLGDFPQATAYTDVLGHTSTAMCNVCTIRRRKGHGLPETNFTSDVHSGRLAYARFNERRAAIRFHAPHEQILRGLGMEYQPTQDTDDLPAVRFAEMYGPKRNAGQVDVDVQRSPLNLCFDHTRSVPILPDHMLASTVSNVMAACFQKLDLDDERAKVEMRVVHAAVINGLQVKRHILSWNHSKGASLTTESQAMLCRRGLVSSQWRGLYFGTCST